MARRRRGDRAERVWRSLGRPGPLAAFRLSFSASSRPVPRTRKGRGKRRSGGGGHRKTYGEGPFARVAPAGNVFPFAGQRTSWERYARDRRDEELRARMRALPRGEVEALQLANIRDRLDSLDLPPEVQSELERIDPTRWYAVEHTVEAYWMSTGDEGEIPEGYDASKRRIRFAGIGKQLWYKIANVAEHSDVTDATVRDVSGRLSDPDLARALALKPGRQAWAIWGNPEMSVTLASGRRFKGRGDYYAWRRGMLARKGGKKRKGGGRLTYEEARAANKADRQAMRRALETQARAAGLRAQGKVAEARRLEQRSEARRGAKPSTGARVRGKGIFARVQPGRRGKKRR